MDMHLNIVQEVALTFLDGLSLLDCLTHLFYVLGHLISSQLSHLVSARHDQVEKDPKTRYHDAKNKFRGREADLLIVILPDNNGSLYGDLKCICETNLGLVSQCCWIKHVFKMSKQYLANFALKINVVASQDYPEITK
ncbi:hypothetical protein ACSQ67_008697 [Phaseolus vulgaris]